MGVLAVFPELSVSFVPWRISRGQGGWGTGKKVVTGEARAFQSCRPEGGIKVS